MSVRAAFGIFVTFGVLACGGGSPSRAPAAPCAAAATASIIGYSDTAVEGERVAITLVPTRLIACEDRQPQRAVVKVLDPNGDPVANDSTPPKFGGEVDTTFEAKLPGWYRITAELEPNFGRSQGEVFVFARPAESWKGVETAGRPRLGPCANLEETANGILLCDGVNVSSAEGLGLGGQTRVVGNVVWAYRDGQVERFTSESGALVSTGRIESNGSRFRELLYATESEAWISELDVGAVRLTWSEQSGLLRTGEIPKRKHDARWISMHGDRVIVFAGGEPGTAPLGVTAPFAPAGAGPGASNSAPENLQFSVCDLPGSQLDAQPSCVEGSGFFVGATAQTVFVYSPDSRTLQESALEGGRLSTRATVRVPSGWMFAPASYNGHNHLGGTPALIRYPDGPSLEIPRSTERSGLVLERRSVEGFALAGANERFVWGTSLASGKLVVHRRAP